MNSFPITVNRIALLALLVCVGLLTTLAGAPAQAPATAASANSAAQTLPTGPPIEDALAFCTGDPISIGFINHEGSPVVDFPDFRQGAQAAVSHINRNLNGLGGRCIDLVICSTVLDPAEIDRCFDLMMAEGVELMTVGINVFTTVHSRFAAVDIAVINGLPLFADEFTESQSYSTSPHGGCLGEMTAMVYFATQVLPAQTGNTIDTVAVPYADNAVVECHLYFQAAPLDILNGSEPGTSPLAGTMPDLTHVDVGVISGDPSEIDTHAQTIMDADPDVIIYQANGEDCLLLVSALSSLGWRADTTPLVLSGSCLGAIPDYYSIEGIYFTHAPGELTRLLDGRPALSLSDAAVYQREARRFGLGTNRIEESFTADGFALMMNLSRLADELEGDGQSVTGQALTDALAATDGSTLAFGGGALNCQDAPEAFGAACTTEVTVSQVVGGQLVPTGPAIDGAVLLEGITPPGQ